MNRSPGLDPEVLADLRRREASAGDRERSRRARNPWAHDVDPPVEHWRCRGGCGVLIGVGQEAVTALAILNVELVVSRQEPISKHAVVWCPDCKRRDDDLAAMQRGTRAPASQQKPRQTELGIADGRPSGMRDQKRRPR